MPEIARYYMSNKKPYAISFFTLTTKDIKMKPEVFVFVLLISVSAERTVKWTDADPPTELIEMVLGTYMHEHAGKGVASSSFRNGFRDPYYYYYDHIIDLCLQRLKLNKKVYSMEASIDKPEQHSSENPVKGTIVFDGLQSLSRYTGDDVLYSEHIFSRRLENGDLELNGTFEFGNISGIGNFSGLNSPKESQNDFFKFHPHTKMIYVSFIITKDPSRRRVSFELQKNYGDRKDINATLLLEQKSFIAFERVFNDLSNIIHERLFSTARKDNPYLDKVMDNVINKFNQNAIKPVNISGGGDIHNLNYTLWINNRWNVSFSLHSLTKLSKVQVINENNGEPELQATIQFGNVSGWGFVQHIILDKEKLYFQVINFTSTPVVIEVLFYLPRNKSLQAKTINILVKPIYTVQARKESFRSLFQQLLERSGSEVYGSPVNTILNETYNEVFPKTNFPKIN